MANILQATFLYALSLYEIVLQIQILLKLIPIVTTNIKPV